MASVEATEIYIGNIVLFQGQLHLVRDTLKVRPHLFSAVTTLMLQPIPDGEIVRTGYVGRQRLDRIDVETRSGTYLREEGEGFVFQVEDSAEPVLVPRVTVGVRGVYLLPGLVAELTFYEGKPILVTLPPRVALTVIEVGPDASDMPPNSLRRPAKVSNGLTVMVPTFIDVGDTILVATDNGTFVKRAA